MALIAMAYHEMYDYDYDYIMAPQRGRPYGANLGSMGRNVIIPDYQANGPVKAGRRR